MCAVSVVAHRIDRTRSSGDFASTVKVAALASAAVTVG